MEIQSTKTSWWKQFGHFWLPILIALSFLVFTFAYYPFQEKLQFDTDEGLNLMRSMLVTLGHPLYTEVSSDQPPLFNMDTGKPGWHPTDLLLIFLPPFPPCLHFLERWVSIRCTLCGMSTLSCSGPVPLCSAFLPGA